MTPQQTTVDIDELSINTIRTLAMDAVQAANSGHPGTPMGLAPIGYVLFTSVLRHNPADPHWPNRDRFVLSAGHACMLQYALLHLCGYQLPMSEIKRFRQWHSKCPGHPEYGLTPGIEVTTGPLGQGAGNAVGFALAEAVLSARYNRIQHPVIDYHTYVICSDGDMQEGISSEAASLAGNLGLGKLIAVYDENHIQIEGSTDLAFSEKVAHRFVDYGWHIHELTEQASLEDIQLAFKEAQAVKDKPSLIVAHTHIAYGSPHLQDNAKAHGSPLGEEEVKLTKKNLGWPYEQPFFVPDEVYRHFATVKEKGARLHSEWAQRYEQYARENPKLARELDEIFRDVLPPIDEPLPKFTPDEDPVATRVASGKALNWFATKIPELIGGSADLAPSTETTINGEEDVLRHAYRGRNLHFGVREHAMGAIINGLTISGLRAYGATFLAFSDYMREPIRLAALMKIPSIFVFTHDSIGLGEDGPTHQPVEHLAALRAVPNLNVIRPADPNETMQAWKFALSQANRPTVLVFSRQKLPVLDPKNIPDDAIEKGAYVYSDSETQPDLILIGTGSEVSLCVASAQKLTEKGMKVRVVSMPSMNQFALQDQSYRDQVLPPQVTARISVEAASPQGWGMWVGDHGSRIALDHFGASAPGPELMQKFGFTPEAVEERALELMENPK